jgi:hypothetical protein
MSLWIEIEAIRARWDIRHHRVHAAWTEAPPTAAELASYAGRHARVLTALAASAERLAESGPFAAPELHDCARGDWFQAARWQALADGADPLPGPALDECVAVWGGSEARRDLEALVILHAIHGARAAAGEALAVAFGRHHAAHACLLAEAQLGREHAAVTRTVVEAAARATRADRDELLSHVEAAYSVHWDLLDELEHATADVALLAA